MKNFIKIIIPIFAIAFVLFSCEGDDMAEQNFMTFDQDAIHFEETSYSVIESSSEVIPVIAFYSSANHDSDVTANVSIQGNSADYNLVDSDLSLNFPAGVYSDTIYVSVNDNFETDNDRDIVFSFDSVSSGANIGFPGDEAIGSTYTLTVVDDDCPYTLEELGNATWAGTDNVPGNQAGPNQSMITTSFDGTNLLMEGIGYGWITDTDYWDEVVVVSTPVIVQISETGSVTIDLQPLCETTWLGDPQPAYFVQGSGIYESCSERFTINYDIVQGGGVLRSFTEVITKQ